VEVKKKITQHELLSIIGFFCGKIAACVHYSFPELPFAGHERQAWTLRTTEQYLVSQMQCFSLSASLIGAPTNVIKSVT
jgi:hypothetical protein